MKGGKRGLTVATADAAESATMSAQETVFGHTNSSSALIASMTSNPSRVKSWNASISAELFAVESKRNDASQPCEGMTVSVRDDSGYRFLMVCGYKLSYSPANGKILASSGSLK